MRLPYGILKSMAKESGFTARYLSDLAATQKRPGRNRALKLEEACRRLGLDVPAMLWLYGAKEEIKRALSEAPVSKDRRSGRDRRGSDPLKDCGGRHSGRDRRKSQGK